MTIPYSAHRPLRHYLLYQGFIPSVHIAIASVSTLGVGEDMIPQWAFRQQRARKDGVSLGEAVWDIELLHSGEEDETCLGSDGNDSTCTASMPQGLVNYCAYLWEEVDRLSELRGQAKIESPRTKELLHVLQTALAESTPPNGCGRLRTSARLRAVASGSPRLRGCHCPGATHTHTQHRR